MTWEEKHTTRGRAKLLYELAEARPARWRDRWARRRVRDALDLCLVCKGCKSDCPVGRRHGHLQGRVPSHYSEGRLRRGRPTPSDRSGAGHVSAARPGSRISSAICRGLRRRVALAGRHGPAAGGPPVRRPDLQGVVRGPRTPPDVGTQPALLWPTPSTTSSNPAVSRAAADVPDPPGFRAALPPGDMRCGRPLYDYGLLDTGPHRLCRYRSRTSPRAQAAPRWSALNRAARGLPRRTGNLFPNNTDAHASPGELNLHTGLNSSPAQGAPLRSAQTRTAKGPAARALPSQSRHGHRDVENRAVLKAMGLDVRVARFRCVAAAWRVSFGFEPGEHYEVSIQCGERVRSCPPCARPATTS